MSEIVATDITVPVPWGSIAAKVWGPKDGYPCLLIHGWQDNAGTWDKLAPLLPEGLRFVAIDLPGHGRSSHFSLAIAYNSPCYLHGIRTLITSMQWKNYACIGHSMGGGLAMLLAALYPQEVTHLIMLDLVKPLSRSLENTVAYLRESLDDFQKLQGKNRPRNTYTYEEAVAKLMKTGFSRLQEDEAKTLLKRGLSPVEERFVFSRDMHMLPKNLFGYTPEQHMTFAKQIRSKMLVIRAKDRAAYESQSIEDAFLATYKASASSFEFVEVEGHHHVHLSHPAIVAPIINTFLQNIKKSNL